MESALAVALLTIAIALTSTVTGKPAAGFLSTQEVAKAQRSGLNFGGGVGFGQKFGQRSDRVVKRVSETFKKRGVTTDGEKKPADVTRRSVSGLDAVTSAPLPVVPQSTAAAVVQDLKPAHDDKAPSSKTLETTTQSRYFVRAGSKCGPNQRVDPGTRRCVDAPAEPDDTSM